MRHSTCAVEVMRSDSAPRRGAHLATLQGLLCLLLASTGPLGAQSNVPIAGFAETNCTGEVYALSAANGVLFAGGDFSYVGPKTGHLAELDTGTGAHNPGIPYVDGPIYSVASDGGGGWYVGGDFDTVGAFQRSNLAHILSNGEVSLWNPGANDRVDSILVVGRNVYIGGLFTTAGGQSRNRIAAIDAATGAATPWDPNSDNPVAALAYEAGVLYAGGNFTAIGAQARNRIAALDPATGTALPWNPDANGNVQVIRIGGGRMYVGGSFTAIGGATRRRIAALDTASGLAIASWDPGAGADTAVSALALSADKLFVGGLFLSLGGQTRSDLGALDLNTGAVTPWVANAGGGVRSLVLADGVLWVAGGFTAIGNPGQPRNYIAALDPETGAVAPWRSDAGSTVTALAIDGSRLCAGGLFESIDGRRRAFLAGIDTTSGAVKEWDPRPNNTVWSVTATADTVYAGGYFSQIGGAWRSSIAAVDPYTGTATDWNPKASQRVSQVAVSDSQVYVVGDFTTVGGQPRSHVAALDILSGQATGWDPSANGWVRAVAPITGSVLLGGSFTTLAGELRNRIGAADSITGLPTAWDPSGDNSVLTITPSGALVYVGGLFTTIGGRSRNHVAALDTATGLATGWDPNADEDVRTVVPDGSTVILGGTFTRVSGQTRARLASVGTDGVLSTWNPDVDPSYPSALVFSAVRSGRTLYVGGRFRAIGGRSHCSLAAFCLWNAPRNLVVASTGQNSVSLSWEGVGASSYAVYRSRRSGGPYTRIGSTSDTEFVDAGVPALSGENRHYYVVRAADECESDSSNEVSAQPSGSCSLAPDFEGVAWVERRTGGACTVDLGWAPATAPCGGAVTYSVYRSNEPGFEPSSASRIASGIGGTGYSDSMVLEPGRRYYYVTRAMSVLTGQEDANGRRQPAQCPGVRRLSVEGCTVTEGDDGATTCSCVVTLSAAEGPTDSPRR